MAAAFYGSLGPRFGVPGPYYGIQGHRGQDFPNAAGTPVPAWEGGKVVLIQYSPFLGTVVVLELNDGKYAGYAHLKAGPPVKMFQVIPAGGTVGVVAGKGDNPGSSWGGPHLHTTLGGTVLAVFAGAVSDPLPRIQNAKAGTAVSTPGISNAGFDLGGIAETVGGITDYLSNGSNWARIGIFALGATVLLIALIKILSNTETGSAVTGVVSTAAKIAVTKKL
jgi:hypothetical protein